MELFLKGRGVRITDQIRRTTEHKLAKIGRLEPRVTRVEVELIEQLDRRSGASHRVEVAVDTSRKVFRAEGAGQDIESALDQVIGHLERQISHHRGKLRDRWTRKGNRLQSARTSPDGPGTSE
jgi:ribosomal subunit interface protein